VNLQLGDTVPERDMPDSDPDMKKRLEYDPGHRCTVDFQWTGCMVGPLADPIVNVSTLVMILQLGFAYLPCSAPFHRDQRAVPGRELVTGCLTPSDSTLDCRQFE
jgi:hypothetical protein